MEQKRNNRRILLFKSILKIDQYALGDTWETLILSRRRPLSYRNQSIDLLPKSMDWFLYDNSLHHKTVKCITYSGIIPVS